MARRVKHPAPTFTAHYFHISTTAFRSHAVLIVHISLSSAVGYNSSTFDSDAQVLRGASFITIGIKDASGNDCTRLSDLKVVGYTGEVGGEDIKIAPLKKDGSNEQLEYEGDYYDIYYFWRDNSSESAGWYGIDDAAMTEEGGSLCGNAENIKFAVGQGICFVVNSSYTGAAVQSAGQVLEAQSSYVFPMDAQNLVCNPLCRQVSLSELTISGYTGEIGGEDIKIAPIKKDGSNQQLEYEGDYYDIYYFWRDNSSESAGWYGIDDAAMTEAGGSLCGDATKIFYKVGEALCVVVNSSYIGCQINFPSLSGSK